MKSWQTSRLGAQRSSAFLMLAMAALLAAGVPAAAFGQSDLSPRALEQIRSLAEDKAARTPAQRKVDSHLLYAAKMVRGQRITAAVPSLPGVLSLVKVDPRGAALVDLQAAVDDDLLAALAGLGARVVAAYPQYGEVHAWLPLASLDQAAALPQVHAIRAAMPPVVNRVMPTGTSVGTGAGAARLAPRSGVHGEGDHAHAADVVRALGFTGTGKKVGVISNGVDSLAAEMTAGHLPAVTVIAGQAGSGDEGTAMLEIVHDLAPDAALAFATSGNTPATMATNIQSLRTAGCDVIVDDVTFFNEGAFEDGPIAQAVTTVTGGGALYFSSAGNSGNQDDGTAGTWEGDFKASATNTPGVGTFHDFGGTIADLITASTGPIDLKWSDPLGGANDDYDLFVLNAGGSVIDASTTTQNGTQDPFEIVAAEPAGGNVAIALFSGASRALRIDTSRGELAIHTAGNTFGHNAAGSALTVAAVDVATAGGNAFVGGSGQPVEVYSSDGPRRLFFLPNGTAITPGNLLFSTGGGQTLSKPDLAAADCVSSNVSGFSPFCGTSAAAPHAAAIAALALSLPIAPSPAQVRACMTGTALDIMAARTDRDSGAGIVMADRTVHCLQVSVPQQAFFTLTPCRLIDTRNPAGPLAGPALQPHVVRNFILPGSCGVPSTALALSVNVTITQPAAAGDLRLYPSDAPSAPLTSTINFKAGQTRANNALLAMPLSAAAGIDVLSDSGGSVHFILDVDGYFQ